jgi:hypothetical protein
MVQIQVSRVISNRKPPRWRNVHTFAFEDVWKLVLDDPFEWHMGANGWRAKLLRNDCDVSNDHQILKSFGTGKRFHLPVRYVPWCGSNPVLVLHPWGSAIHFYDVHNRKARPRELANFPLEIQNWIGTSP